MNYLPVIFAFFLVQSVFADREAPDAVEAVKHNGVVYTAPHWGESLSKEGKRLGQNGGLLVATDEKTNKVLWKKIIYKIEYNKDLEGDVQDVFITGISLSDDKKKLIIKNEKGETYHLNLKTKKVLQVGKEEPIK